MGEEGCKPCCCCSNQAGCRIIGALQILGAIYSMGVGGYAIMVVASIKQDAKKQGVESINYDVLLGLLIFILILAVISLFLGIILMLGANGDIGKCRIWFYSTIVLLIVDIIIQIAVGIYYEVYVGFILQFFIQIYFLWVVDSYIQDLKGSNGNTV